MSQLITPKERAQARAREALRELKALPDSAPVWQRQSLRDIAALWERIAGEGEPLSFKPLRQQLETLKADTVTALKAASTEPPKAPPPAAAPKPEPTQAEIMSNFWRAVESKEIAF